MILVLSTVRLTRLMKRFNNVNLHIESQNIIDYIFKTTKKANDLGFGGLRESGFEKVNINFFTFVFLCGGNPEMYESRSLLTEKLQKNTNVKIIISEKLEKFKGNLDLLTFETILENISKMILIPVESLGTACELGAFTRINDENNKVVAIVDNKYVHKKSFLNYGPIQLLKEIGIDRVIPATFTCSGGKHYLLTNNTIENISNHNLITNKFKMSKYFVKKESETDNGSIKNLNSFMIAILDYICLVGFVTVDMICEFFSRLLNDDMFSIYDQSMMKKTNAQTKEIIKCFLHILESVGFLYEKDDIFFVKSDVLAPQMKSGERWIGKVLFTNAFTCTDEYLKIKCKCEEIKNRIIKYGYYK